jgi:ribosomal protein S18 acetylase RimI-like enzyme
MTRVTVETNAAEADVAVVREGLLAFNVAVIGPAHQARVAVFLRDGDADDAVVGGLLGVIRWRWLYIEKLWIAPDFRGNGNGSKLMHAAESHARSRDCIGIQVDTFEHQARAFYEKLGYELFGTLEGYPPGSRQYFLVKRLAASGI